MASHLTQTQIEELRDMLRERRDELRAEIAEELQRQENDMFADLATQVHDTEEESVAGLLVDLNLSSIARHVQELNAVESGLTRIQTGEYGICEDTGEPIPYERLKAYPSATRTVQAQEQYERRDPDARHPTM